MIGGSRPSRAGPTTATGRSASRWCGAAAKSVARSLARLPCGSASCTSRTRRSALLAALALAAGAHQGPGLPQPGVLVPPGFLLAVGAPQGEMAGLGARGDGGVEAHLEAQVASQLPGRVQHALDE